MYEYQFEHDKDVSKKEEETVHFLEGIVDALYVTGESEILEHCLEELCGLYDISLDGKIQFEKKDKNKLMHWYLGYQRATIENMTRKKI